MLDQNFCDDQTGLGAMEEFKIASPRSHIVLMTGNYREEDENVAISRGAFYVEKGDLRVLRLLAVLARRRVSSFFSPSSSGHLH